MTHEPADKKKFYRQNLFWLIVVAIVCFIVFKDIYKGKFFLDDYLHLHLVQKIKNPAIPFFTDIMMSAFFRPGIFIFWRLDYLLFGLQAYGYYLTNIIFLLGTAYILFFIMLHLTGNRRIAGFTSLLVAIGPVTTVGVLWLSNRFDLIGTFFFMLSLLLFLQYVRFKKRDQIMWSLLFGFFSFFCKEMTITLPVILILAASFMFLNRSKLTWPRLREIVSLSTPYFTLAVIFMMWRYLIINSIGGYIGETRVPIKAGYLAELYFRFSDYLWLLRFKWVVIIWGLIFLILLYREDFSRKNKSFWFGALFTVITVAPLAMIFTARAVMTYMTPRFFYLPNIGMTILLASLYQPKSSNFKRVCTMIFLSITVLLFAVNSYLISRKWVNDTTKYVSNAEKIYSYLKSQSQYITPGSTYQIYACGRKLDVALDSSIKIFHPEVMSLGYILNCAGPTQVIGTEQLQNVRGKNLNFPRTFRSNPCKYKDLYYGVVLSSPKDILINMAKDPRVTLVMKDKTGHFMTISRNVAARFLSYLGFIAP